MLASGLHSYRNEALTHQEGQRNVQTSCFVYTFYDELLGMSLEPHLDLMASLKNCSIAGPLRSL